MIFCQFPDKPVKKAGASDVFHPENPGFALMLILDMVIGLIPVAGLMIFMGITGDGKTTAGHDHQTCNEPETELFFDFSFPKF